MWFEFIISLLALFFSINSKFELVKLPPAVQQSNIIEINNFIKLFESLSVYYMQSTENQNPQTDTIIPDNSPSNPISTEQSSNINTQFICYSKFEYDEIMREKEKIKSNLKEEENNNGWLSTIMMVITLLWVLYNINKLCFHFSFFNYYDSKTVNNNVVNKKVLHKTSIYPDPPNGKKYVDRKRTYLLENDTK